MAPVAISNTPRFWVDYTANGHAHTILFRYPEDVPGQPPSAAVIAELQAFFLAVSPWMPVDVAPTAMRYAAKGSTVSNPVPGALINMYGAGTVRPYSAPAFVTFVGRSADGRKTKVTLLGTYLIPGQIAGASDDYRLTVAEEGNIQTAIDNLEDAGLVTISGQAPVWYPYVNLGYNAYWQKELRT